MIISECSSTSFVIGDCELLPTNGYEFAINITENGVSVNADSERGLVHGFLSLIELIEPCELDVGCEKLAIPVQ
jgi:hypothetical protein